VWKTFLDSDTPTNSLLYVLIYLLAEASILLGFHHRRWRERERVERERERERDSFDLYSPDVQIN